MLELRLDQTDFQVDASSILESPCDSVWQGLALNCVDLRWLVLTLVEIKLERKPTQVFHRLARQPKSTQVEWRPFVVKTIYSNTGYIALKCFFCLFCFVLFFFSGFWRLACTCEETCESVWPPNASLYASSTCGHFRVHLARTLHKNSEVTRKVLKTEP